MKVVCIDDDPDDQEFFAECMALIDPSIETITYGAVLPALYEMKDMVKKPSYIFLDINMQPVDGKICLTLLKADEKLKAVPVIMLSTSNNINEIMECKNKGAISYIPKPTQQAELIKSLKPFFESRVISSN